MAAPVLQDQAAMQTAVEEFYNFLETFNALGAGGSVTVIDVFLRMTERGLPTTYIGRYLQNTDPPTTATTGKTVKRFLKLRFKYLTFHGCYRQTELSQTDRA